MTILTCRYCRRQCSDRDVMKISDSPDEVNWFSSHYMKCTGMKESLRCLCGDSIRRCECDDCNGCIKTPSLQCTSMMHPKTYEDLEKIRALESVNSVQELESYCTSRDKLMRLRYITPLSDIVRTSK